MPHSFCDQPVIIVHGGAWKVPPHLHAPSLEGVKRAAVRGYLSLIPKEPQLNSHYSANGYSNGTSPTKIYLDAANESSEAPDKRCLDAVEASVRDLESDPVFDAGRGSCLTRAGTVEMDSAVMSCVKHVPKPRLGCLGAVTRVEHAVTGARAVLEHGEHALLVASGAEQFLKLHTNIKLLPENDQSTLVTNAMKEDLERFHANYETAISELFGHDTVGAVALDGEGNIACATSTGGITGKRVGRIGDSPIVGSGLYAQTDIGAAVATGHGESILRACLCKHAVQSVAIKESITGKQECIEEAVRNALQFMDYMNTERGDGGGGVVALHVNGQWTAQFSTVHMPWACVDKAGRVHAGIEPGQVIECGHYTDLDYEFIDADM